MQNTFFILGLVLTFVGLAVSILFWVPKLVNKERLKELLGPKYPIIYFVYFSNGPMLVALGGLLIYKFK